MDQVDWRAAFRAKKDANTVTVFIDSHHAGLDVLMSYQLPSSNYKHFGPLLLARGETYWFVGKTDYPWPYSSIYLQKPGLFVIFPGKKLCIKVDESLPPSFLIESMPGASLDVRVIWRKKKTFTSKVFFVDGSWFGRLEGCLPGEEVSEYSTYRDGELRNFFF